MEITTKDMYLAAILVSYGSPIVDVDRSDPKKQWFHFDKIPTLVFISSISGDPEQVTVEDLETIRSHYLSKKLYFPPSFVDCLRSVKAYLYSEEHVHD